MKKIYTGVLVLSGLSLSLRAQLADEEKGFELGILRVRPQIEVLGAYDDRIAVDEAGDTLDDLYGEVSAGLYLNNTPARYNLAGRAVYGYRAYDEFNNLDDDFYDVGLSVASRENPLKLGLSSYYKKTLDYDTRIDLSTGQEPGAILTANTSTRFSTKADVGYERQLTDKTALMPGYEGWYYYQDFEDDVRDDAEWQVHRAGLQLGYGLTEKTVFTLSGYYSLQVNDDEDGNIGAVMLGARSRASDKTRWQAQVGYAAADYEESGRDESVISQLRLTWQATDKVSAFVVGGNDFQPGYSGGAARVLYRLGYGVDWRIISRWLLRGQILHDYEDPLGRSSSFSSDDLRHFFTALTSYDLTKNISLALTGRYIIDEIDEDRGIVSLKAVFSY
jgi:hypothetical protein